MKKKKIISSLIISGFFALALSSIALKQTATAMADTIDFEIASALQSTYAVGTTVEFPSGAFTIGNTDYPAEIIVYTPNGYGYKTNRLTLEQYGEYTVQYRAEIDGKWEVEEYTFFTTKSQFSVSSSNSSAEYGRDDTGWNVGNKQEGLVLKLAKGDEFICSEPIDLNAINGQSFIEFALLPETPGGTDAKELYIQLIDAEDKNNCVDIYLKLLNGSQTYTYIVGKAPDQLYAGMEYWKNQTMHINDIYGCPLMYTPGGNTTNMTTNDVKLLYDAEGNGLYFSTIHAQNEIVDFDDSYQTNPWKGFTSGNAYLKIFAKDYRSDSLTMLIKRIGNVDLSQEDFVDNVGPTISIESGEMQLDDMPKAVVGKKYQILDAKAGDLFAAEGSIKVQKRVYYGYHRVTGTYNSPSTDFIYEIDTYGNEFLADTVGSYAIVYSATDWNGNYTEKVIVVEAEENNVNPLSFALQSGYKTSSTLGNAIKLAAVQDISGVVGMTTLSYAVTLNGQPVTLSGNTINGYQFIARSAGEYTVLVTLKDFVGNVKTQSYTVTVAESTQPAFQEAPALPQWFIQNEGYLLPTLYAVHPTTGEAVSTTLTIIDGLGERSYDGGMASFVPNNNGEVVLRYTAGEAFVEYAVPVISVRAEEKLSVDKYFAVTDGELGISNENLGVYVSASKVDGVATFIKPLVDNNVNISIKIDSFMNDFEFLDFICEDSVDASQKFVVSVQKADADSLYTTLYINGKNTGMRVLNPFYTDKTFAVVYDGTTNAVSVGGSASVAITETVLGNPFNGFSSGELYVSVGLSGVRSRSGIFVNQINMQSLSAGVVRDTVSPDTYMSGEYTSSEVKKGTTVTVYSMEVSDVLSNVVYSSVSVTDTKGYYLYSTEGILMCNQSVDKEYLFVADTIGTYLVTYTVIDSAGKTAAYTYPFVVIDTVAPTFDKVVNITSEGKLGETLSLPTMTATDDLDGKVSVYVYVFYPDSILRDVTNEMKFTFTQVGEYTVKYVAFDTLGNTVTRNYTITVRG